MAASSDSRRGRAYASRLNCSHDCTLPLAMSRGYGECPNASRKMPLFDVGKYLVRMSDSRQGDRRSSAFVADHGLGINDTWAAWAVLDVAQAAWACALRECGIFVERCATRSS